MLAFNFFGWQIPHGELVVPGVVGLVVGVLALLGVRWLSRDAPAAKEPPQPKAEEPDPFVYGSQTENRQAYRRGGNPVEVFLSRQGARDRSRGRVVDRSVGGLCLEVSLEFEPGTVLQVLPVNAPKITPWTNVEVRSCRPTRDGFEIGCQFVKTPSWEVLLLFG